MPRSRNTRIRPKDTSRAEARRRYRDEVREAEADEQDESAEDTTSQPAETQAQRPALALPDVADDIRALPQVFRKPLVWLPFGLLLSAFLVGLAVINEAIPEGQVNDILLLFFNLTLPPTSLFVFFIGGFVAPRASYLVGGILGIVDAFLYTVLLMMGQAKLQEVGVVEATAGGTELADYVPLWGIAVLVGVFAAGFAAWYRRFLRSSSERAKANKMAKEQEQARQAREQAREDKRRAREDKYAAREARRKGK